VSPDLKEKTNRITRARYWAEDTGGDSRSQKKVWNGSRHDFPKASGSHQTGNCLGEQVRGGGGGGKEQGGITRRKEGRWEVYEGTIKLLLGKNGVTRQDHV